MKKIVLFVAAFALLAGGVLVGCGSKSSDAGRLVIYSPNTEDLVNNIITAFEKETGVKVEIISTGTGEIFKRVEAEKNSPNADVLWGGSWAVYASNLDLLEEYVSANDKDLPVQYQNVTKKITTYCLDGSVILVNTDLIGNIKVEGYMDLLNPALKGKIAMGDPSNSSSAFAHLTNMLLDIGKNYTSAAGWDYVKALLIQVNGKILNSSSAVHKGVAGGEYTVGITYEDPSAAYVRDGAPVKIVYMKEGVVFLYPGSAIVKGAKNLDNAKKFIDFITSKTAQDIIGTKLTVRPVRADATLGSYMKPMNEITILSEDYDYVQKHKNEIVEQYKKIFTQVSK
ncbi:MAG: ABC transporter substrate-binding protein [Elusimicrobiota bacterium]|jgi:iron(III) transport system substrate-binding protein|nr:ABC transporter substrate-binding protein [Elusimicrobiota bacterium]